MDLVPARRRGSGRDDSDKRKKSSTKVSSEGTAGKNLKITMENIISRLLTDQAYAGGIDTKSMVPFLRSLYRVSMGSTRTLIDLPLPVGCPPSSYTMVPEGCVVSSRGPHAVNGIGHVTEHDLDVVTSDTRLNVVQNLVSYSIMSPNVPQPGNVPYVPVQVPTRVPTQSPYGPSAVSEHSWTNSVDYRMFLDPGSQGQAVPSPLRTRVETVPEGSVVSSTGTFVRPAPNFQDVPTGMIIGSVAPSEAPAPVGVARSDAGSDTTSIRSGGSRMGFKTNASLRGGGHMSNGRPSRHIQLDDD